MAAIALALFFSRAVFQTDLQQFLQVLLLGAIVALAGPFVRVRRSAGLLVLTPVVGLVVFGVFAWRLVNLPDRYWSDELWPTWSRRAWTAALVASVVVAGLYVNAAAHEMGYGAKSWRTTAIDAVAQPGATVVVMEHRVRSATIEYDTARRDGRRFAIVEAHADGDHNYFYGMNLRPQHQRLGTRWHVTGKTSATCRFGTGDDTCMYRVDRRAVAATITMIGGESARVAVRDGFAVFFLRELHLPTMSGLVDAVVAVDKDGHELPRLPGACEPLQPPPPRPVVPAGAPNVREPAVGAAGITPRSPNPCGFPIG